MELIFVSYDNSLNFEKPLAVYAATDYFRDTFPAAMFNPNAYPFLKTERAFPG